MDHYIQSYKYYLSFNTVGHVKIPEGVLKRLYSTHILDFACGGGDRTAEFINLVGTQDAEIFGYDANPEWKAFWEETLRQYDRVWLFEPPQTFEGAIHCSHGVYMPQVRDTVFHIFENSENACLAIRGFGQSSIFTKITEEFDLPDTRYWEDRVHERVRKNNYQCQSFSIPTRVAVPEAQIPAYAQSISDFVVGGEGRKKIEEVLYRHCQAGWAAFDNSDIFYVISKHS